MTEGLLKTFHKEYNTLSVRNKSVKFKIN